MIFFPPPKKRFAVELFIDREMGTTICPIKCMVFDLDNTLIKSNVRGNEIEVMQRPGALELLNFCKDNYVGVVIYSAGTLDYIIGVMNTINFVPHMILSRFDMVPHHIGTDIDGQTRTKTLDYVSKKTHIKRQNMLAIDDNYSNYPDPCDFGRVIRCAPWNGDPCDGELLHYLDILRAHTNRASVCYPLAT